MFMLRDFATAMSLSGLFEVVEMSLQHWFPNFRECWWDRVFLNLFSISSFSDYNLTIHNIHNTFSILCFVTDLGLSLDILR